MEDAQPHGALALRRRIVENPAIGRGDPRIGHALALRRQPDAVRFRADGIVILRFGIQGEIVRLAFGRGLDPWDGAADLPRG